MRSVTGRNHHYQELKVHVKGLHQGNINLEVCMKELEKVFVAYQSLRGIGIQTMEYAQPGLTKSPACHL